MLPEHLTHSMLIENDIARFRQPAMSFLFCPCFVTLECRNTFYKEKTDIKIKNFVFSPEISIFVLFEYIIVGRENLLLTNERRMTNGNK